MISHNTEILNSLLTSLSEIVDANVSVLDNNFEGGIIQNLGNKSKICTEFHNFIKNECKKSDMNAFQNCQKINTFFDYRCHLGFKEILIPFSLNYKTKLYIMIGPFVDDQSANLAKKSLSDAGVTNIDYIDKLLAKIPFLSEKKYKSIVDITNRLFEYAQTSKLIALQDNFIDNKLNPYLSAHLSKDITISELVKNFFYSQKQLESIVRDYSGLTTKKYITKYKIDAAKKMFITTNKSLQQIAQDVGFYDYNYFIKVFKSICNDTPFQYRKKYKNKTY